MLLSPYQNRRWDSDLLTIRRLLEAGFEPALARRVAEGPTMDVHALLDLVDRGCPPELAVRILSPAEPAR